MCEIRHNILIKNLTNNEIIPNEILLINGVISKRCSFSSEIIVHEENSNLKVHTLISKTGEFKILWQLLPGINRFKFNYCKLCENIQCYFKNNDDTTNYKIQPLIIICKSNDDDNNSNSNDEKCLKSNHSNNHIIRIQEAKEKITLALKLVQCLYAENLRKNNNRQTFTINSDCIPFYSNLDVNEARQLDENTLWSIFATELLNSDIYAENKNLKFVGFIECTLYEGLKVDGDYSYENIKRHTKATASLGGGGLALFGTGCLYTWPLKFNEIIKCFTNNEKIDMKYYLDDSNYRRTYGGCFTTTLGSVCHEIGHIFDLGHTEYGIMGNDFDYINHIFVNNIDYIHNRNLIENLPDRIIIKNDENKKLDQRLTKIQNKLNNNKFLQKYHIQKNANDFGYFTLNCILILRYHKWLNPKSNSNNSDSIENNTTYHSDDDNDNDDEIIKFDKNTYTIYTDKSFLILIELRTKLNGFVTKYFDLTQKHIKKFSLINNNNSKINNSCNSTAIIDLNQFNIFVITADGTTKLFE